MQAANALALKGLCSSCQSTLLQITSNLCTLALVDSLNLRVVVLKLSRWLLLAPTYSLPLSRSSTAS